MYKKHLLFLIIIATVIRIITAAVLEFGNDEVYYYTYALHLQSNYFDHPPGVAILIKFFTLNLYLQSEVFVRLGSIVFAAIGTWLCFGIGSFIRNERTGWFAAILYNTSIYTSVIASTFILPDSPQVVCWLASLYMLFIIIQQQHTQQQNALSWLLFGVLNGLCIMSKVHGIFIWAGFGLYILLYERKMLLNPWLYVSIIITAVIISPIFFWNLHNNFITWRYHSERVKVEHFSLDTDGFIQTIFGQLFYNNPLNVIATIIALFYARKHALFNKSNKRILFFCGWPIIIVVTGIALFRDVLPHWSGPGFMTLSFITAAYLDDKFATKPLFRWPMFIKATTIFMIVIFIGGICFIKLYPGTIGETKSKEEYGSLDFTLDMTGWTAFGKDFTTWEKEAVAQKQIQPNLLIACDKWFPAAHIDYYVAKQLPTHVVGVGYMEDLHQYVWLNRYRGSLQAGNDALCIVPSNYPVEMNKTYGQYFSEAILLKTFTAERSGKIVRYFYVYLLKGYKANDEAFSARVN